MLWITETTIFILTIARLFIQRKQPYLWFIANNDRNMLWGHNADNYFLNLSWNILHTIYILQLQQPVHRLKMDILMSQCTNETTQTTMDTTPTTTFWILAKTYMHTICKLQREKPVYRFKAKCTNETTQATFFSIGNKNVLTLKTTYTTSFP